MPDGLRLESEQARTNGVRGQRICARDHQTGFDRMPAEGPGGDHDGMADGDGEIDRTSGTDHAQA
jgi:hypothetical protein